MGQVWAAAWKQTPRPRAGKAEESAVEEAVAARPAWGCAWGVCPPALNAGPSPPLPVCLAAGSVFSPVGKGGSRPLARTKAALPCRSEGTGRSPGSLL